MINIKNPRDFGAAALFIAIGCLGLWVAQDYTFGTSARMGPGYFPILISSVLVVLGMVTGLGSLRISGSAIAEMHWRSTILIVAGIVIFGSTIDVVGLIPAVLITVVMTAFASGESRWKEVIPLAIFLAAFCTAIFVYALNQPLTLIGGR